MSSAVFCNRDLRSNGFGRALASQWRCMMPAFDVALVGRADDAFIAGTAAPDAAVELLRNGEPLDRASAHQIGQFAMTPSRLPAGDCELTLLHQARLDCDRHTPAGRSLLAVPLPRPQRPVLFTKIIEMPSRNAVQADNANPEASPRPAS